MHEFSAKVNAGKSPKALGIDISACTDLTAAACKANVCILEAEVVQPATRSTVFTVKSDFRLLT